MEATIGGEVQLFRGINPANLRAAAKRSLEWDSNDWRWDGDLFIATPVTSNRPECPSRQFFPAGARIPVAGGSTNSSSSCSDDVIPGFEKEKRELEKRRRVIVVEDDNLEEEAGSLTLKLGRQDYFMTEREVRNWDGTNGKKIKLIGTNSNRAVCQVEDCGADLSTAKDYHRRHKVCEMHSKASKALVGKVLQRFCQQCSRFHMLQEFDEGKRSCRRRLAGHNKRRRKAQPDAVVNNNSLNDDRTSSYLLISLLKILSNLHSNGSDQISDQDLLSHLLRSLTNNNGLHVDRNICGLLQESQNLLNGGTSIGNSELVSALHSNGSQSPPESSQQCIPVTASKMLWRGPCMDDLRSVDIRTASFQKPVALCTKDSCPPACLEAQRSSVRNTLNNFNLNDVYMDSDDGMEDVDRSTVPLDQGTASPECPTWVQQDCHRSSPPQTSGNSDSASAHSPSSSSGEARSRTDRIVFKLFGKEPNDIPYILRAQILDWLSHSPTDIESYIRPGCVVLTVYLCLSDSAWDELCYDLGSSLSRLLDASYDDAFWKSGWIYVRVLHQAAFMYNGHVVVESSLSSKKDTSSTILTIKPVAVSMSETVQFLVKGFNLKRSSTRLLCALEGSYLVQETSGELRNNVDSNQPDEEHCRKLSCSIPAVIGRGFIEVEDQGLSTSFFPFVVAEKDVCSEIRMLESAIELTGTDDMHGKNAKAEARNQAMYFIQEMGWLLHRCGLKSRLGHLDCDLGRFPLRRFKWLIEFSVDHDWCAVVKKLLDILLGGMVVTGDQTSLKLALSDIGLLHRAVRRNSRPLVELLLRYVPEKVSDDLRSELDSLCRDDGNLLFRPDDVGPSGLTPLHVAAGRDGSKDVLDALTDDPGKVGVEAWKTARDSTGFTPEDYARLRGHYLYIHLIQKKINRTYGTGHLVLDIPGVLSNRDINQKQSDERAATLQIGRAEMRPVQGCCRICERKLACGNVNRSLVYRPAMLSLMAVAAVCVCVALLFKSLPEVLYVFQPFRWELLDYGSM